MTLTTTPPPPDSPNSEPLLDPGDPQSLNGYTYADNNPITNEDANGLNCASEASCRAYICHADDPTATTLHTNLKPSPEDSDQ